eukprot:m.342734 g.342734  ORF g.342734 m.342734 type:complete len:497 (-) comp21759_c0_seq1:188-1678(-)
MGSSFFTVFVCVVLISRMGVCQTCTSPKRGFRSKLRCTTTVTDTSFTTITSYTTLTVSTATITTTVTETSQTETTLSVTDTSVSKTSTETITSMTTSTFNCFVARCGANDNSLCSTQAASDPAEECKNSNLPIKLPMNLGITCFCDWICEDYGDCCWDKPYACDGVTTTHTSTQTYNGPVSPLRQSWTKLSDGLEEIRGSAGMLVGNNLFIFGGFTPPFWYGMSNRTSVYSIVDDKWSNRGIIPGSAAGITHQGCTKKGNIVYLCGGLSLDEGSHWPNAGIVSKVWSYNTVNDTWSFLPDLPEARAGGACVVVGDYLHFMGGGFYEDGLRFSADKDDHWQLNLNDIARGWIPKAKLNGGGRNNFGCVEHSGAIYIIGGQRFNNDGLDGKVNTVQRYLPAQDAWEHVTFLDEGISHTTHSLDSFHNGLLQSGGTNANNNGVSKMEYYDLTLEKWFDVSGGVTVPLDHPSLITGVAENAIYAYRGIKLYKGELVILDS